MCDLFGDGGSKQTVQTANTSANDVSVGVTSNTGVQVNNNVAAVDLSPVGNAIAALSGALVTTNANTTAAFAQVATGFQAAIVDASTAEGAAIAANTKAVQDAAKASAAQATQATADNAHSLHIQVALGVAALIVALMTAHLLRGFHV